MAGKNHKKKLSHARVEELVKLADMVGKGEADLDGGVRELIDGALKIHTLDLRGMFQLLGRYYSFKQLSRWLQGKPMLE